MTAVSVSRHWLNISSFSVKKLVKNVLNFTAIFQWKTKWKTWNLFMNFLNFKTFSALFQKFFTRFKKITKMFQVFHLLFWRKIAVKFRTFFTKIFSAKLEMFNQCYPQMLGPFQHSIESCDWQFELTCVCIYIPGYIWQIIITPRRLMVI